MALNLRFRIENWAIQNRVIRRSQRKHQRMSHDSNLTASWGRCRFAFSQCPKSSNAEHVVIGELLPNLRFPRISLLECRKWGCKKWGFKGCLASRPGNRPKSAIFALFLPFSPFSGGPEQHLENPENGGKGPFSSDILGFA